MRFNAEPEQNASKKHVRGTLPCQEKSVNVLPEAVQVEIAGMCQDLTSKDREADGNAR